jgi:acetyl esterase/lipase
VRRTCCRLRVEWLPGLRPLAVALVVLALPACRVTDLPLWGLAQPSAPDAYEVERVWDVAYYSGPGADSVRHRLDLFLPRGQKGYPVVVLVHGGAWVMGDNRCCGLYSAVGEFLASRGVGVALPNYRLSPGVKHPEHVKDVARAVAWVRAHSADFGGCPNQIFLVGHSAGGHLAALLATDERYLKAEGLCSADIRGVIVLGGVYRIPAGNLEVTLGGVPPQAIGLDKVVPLRGDSRRTAAGLPGVPGIPLSVNLYGPVFGNDPQARREASPLHHVRPGLPPFLLFSAEHDLPTLPGMAKEFHRALRDEGVEARWVTIKGRNHNSLMFGAIEPNDPTAQTLLEFIWRHTVDAPLASRPRG